MFSFGKLLSNRTLSPSEKSDDSFFYEDTSMVTDHGDHFMHYNTMDFGNKKSEIISDTISGFITNSPIISNDCDIYPVTEVLEKDKTLNDKDTIKQLQAKLKLIEKAHDSDRIHWNKAIKSSRREINKLTEENKDLKSLIDNLNNSLTQKNIQLKLCEERKADILSEKDLDNNTDFVGDSVSTEDKFSTKDTISTDDDSSTDVNVMDVQLICRKNNSNQGKSHDDLLQELIEIKMAYAILATESDKEHIKQCLELQRQVRMQELAIENLQAEIFMREEKHEMDRRNWSTEKQYMPRKVT